MAPLYPDQTFVFGPLPPATAPAASRNPEELRRRVSFMPANAPRESQADSVPATGTAAQSISSNQSFTGLESVADPAASSLALRVMILAAFVLLFCDEAVRKFIPGQPVHVTAVKDALLFASAAMLLLRPVPGKGWLLMFLPWVVMVTISMSLVFARYYSIAGVLASVRTYLGGAAFFLVGLHIAQDRRLLRGLLVIGLVGSFATLGIAIVQEHALGLLPSPLQQNIYKYAHDVAGGRFNEGTFASAQVLSQVIVTVVTFTFAALIVDTKTWHRVLLVVLLTVGAYGLYIARIRIAVLAQALTLLFVLMALPRANVSRWGSVGRLAISMFLLAAFAFIGSLLLPQANVFKTAEDQSFYGRSLQLDVIERRLFHFTSEVKGESGKEAFGYGLGTAGAVRRIIGDPHLLQLRSVSDSGIALVYFEVGLIGFAAFALCYIGLPVVGWFRLVVGSRVPLIGVAALAVSWGLMGWFLFKSHTVLGNGASHLIWMTCTGLFFGSVALQRRAMGDAAPSEAGPRHFGRAS